MNTSIFDLDNETIIEVIASSDGDMSLAAERLCTRLEVPFGAITDYDMQARLVKFDQTSADTLAGKLRTLLVIKLYNLISVATHELQGSICDLRPAELARTHASLSQTFHNLTATSTKVTFDFPAEIAAMAAEFNIPVEDIKADLKDMESKGKIRAVK